MAATIPRHMRAAFLLALAGTTIAVLVTTTTYVLGALAGLAQNPAGDEAIRDSSRLLVVSGLSGIGCVLLRRHPPAGVACLALAGGGGFLVGNPLWIFAAIPLLGAALLATAISRQGKDRARRP